MMHRSLHARPGPAVAPRSSLSLALPLAFHLALGTLTATLAPGLHPASVESVWPLAPRPAVVRPFEEPSHRYSAGHRGVDLLGLPGQEVRAPRAGLVRFSGSVAGVAVVTLEHPDGLRTTYQPVVSALAPGTPVHAGEAVGHLAPVENHCSPLLCLHWGMRDPALDIYLDPLRWMHGRRVVLLPLDD